MKATKRKVVTWLLSLCMVCSLFAGVPVNAAWDDDYEQNEDNWVKPVYGLIATEYLHTEWDDETDSEYLLLTEDGYPAYEDEDGELWPIDYTDWYETTFSGEKFWFDYRDTVDGERTHVTADDLIVEYYGNKNPHAEPDASHETKTGLVSDNTEPGWEGVVNFMPDTNKPGFYAFSYAEKPDEKMAIYVDFPEVGFYSRPELAKTYLLSSEYSANTVNEHMFLNGEDNDIYMYLYSSDDRQLTLADGSLDGLEEDEEPEETCAFEIEVENDDNWNYFYGDVTGIDNFFRAEPVDGMEGWYLLDFQEYNPTITEEYEDEDDYESWDWEPDSLRLQVNVIETYADDDEDENICNAYFNYFYQETGLYAQVQNDPYTYSETRGVIDTGLAPKRLSLSFGMVDVDDDTGEVVNQKFTPALEDLTIEKVVDWDEDEPIDWADVEEGAVECEVNGDYIDFAFYVQDRYCISCEDIDGCVYVNAYLDGLSFFTTPVRPGDGEKVDNQIEEITVNEGKSNKVYALAWVAEDQPWSIKADTIAAKAIVNGEEKTSYINKSTEIKANIPNWADPDLLEEKLIGYEIEITDQAKEDFDIVITANLNGKGIYWDEDDEPVEYEDDYAMDSFAEATLHVEVNNIDKIKIVNPPKTTSYYEGDKFDSTDMKVNVVYENGDEEPITNYTIEPAGALKTTDKTVTISYSGKTTTQNITVTAKPSATPDPNGGTTASPTPAVKAGDTVKDKVATYAVSNVSKKEVTVKSVSASAKKATKITIPATVKINGVSYKVTAIGKNAFKNAKAKTIVLGKNVTRIEKNAFANCKKLQKLKVNSKLQSVAKGAFKGCKKKITVSGKSKKANVKKLKESGYKKFK